ncbi:Clp protease ClpP [Streptomyces sp. HP-A2021]|uniref:head maturation protease, ClpP-related n=1 Tax=Streptomyces sp. HP-A2021 TaxID=2927875 RepID=UPI001FAFA651|nr:head maturation protease, ClpP-related [Streptomyces sp. HP-A2021]UOB09074.1 Clp protease ClpP [Streptomyces sp. HP-A2021]
MSRMPGLALPANLTTFLAKQREQADKLRAQHGVEPTSWYRITNSSGDEAEVMLYDEIGGWWGATADDFIRDLRAISAPKVRVRVNSPGGSVFEGVAIANAIRGMSADVTIQVDGIAASIASVIAMAGDRIVMMPNTTLMIHDASGVCMGNAADMAEMEELLDLISDNIADAYAARAGGTRDEWRARMRAETWYLPEDAVEAGLADEVVPTPARPGQEPDTEPDMRKVFDISAYGYRGMLPREEPPAEPTLTEDIRSLIGEEIAAQLAAAVTPPVEATTPVEPVTETTPVEPAPEEPAAVPEPEAPAAEPVDEWAAAVAHLTQPKPDPWAAAVAHLTRSTSAASSATEAA